jgi:hypothetical protein
MGMNSQNYSKSNETVYGMNETAILVILRSTITGER